ncbi:MAG: DUF192 domain-containing protein [Actinomycetota bacterium]
MQVSITVAGSSTVVAREALVARTPWQRMRGLLGRPRLVEGQALILSRARRVHTIGMRYPIDVVFCDDRWTVVAIARDLRPGRISLFVRQARWAIELPSGAARFEEGDGLEVSGL